MWPGRVLVLGRCASQPRAICRATCSVALLSLWRRPVRPSSIVRLKGRALRLTLAALRDCCLCQPGPITYLWVPSEHCARYACAFYTPEHT